VAHREGKGIAQDRRCRSARDGCVRSGAARAGVSKNRLTPTPYPRVVTVGRGRLVAGSLSPYRVRTGFLGMALTYVRQRTARRRNSKSRGRAGAGSSLKCPLSKIVFNAVTTETHSGDSFTASYTPALQTCHSLSCLAPVMGAPIFRGVFPLLTMGESPRVPTGRRRIPHRE
jgi:hypothetical protein